MKYIGRLWERKNLANLATFDCQPISGLDNANQKAQLFEAMLEVIRKEYGVKLPKKPSGESSSKGR